MKTKLKQVLGWFLLIVAGAIVVSVAENQGWLASLESATTLDCPHSLDDQGCPFCDPSLIEKKGPCVEHGVPEALCTKCNPTLINAFKIEQDWCAEHQFPESQCTICNPGLLTSGTNDETTFSTTTGAELVRALDVPRSQRQPSVTCQNFKLRIRFKTSAIAHAAGLEYARVKRHNVTETISCNGEITYDRNRYAQLSSRAPGVIREVKMDLGRAVQAKDILAVVDSADLGLAKADFLRTRTVLGFWEKKYVSEKRLLESNVSARLEVLEVETTYLTSRIALAKATQELRNLGLSDVQIKETEKTMDTSSLLPLRAPFVGVVVERDAVLGEVVDTKQVLFVIVDMSHMWGMLDIYGADVARVRTGQPVVFMVDGLRGEQHGGFITWIGTEIDRRTRTLKIRVEIPNPDGILRSGMFGKALIRIRDNEAVLTVPKEAVQWDGCCNIIFVKKSETLFEPRKVKLGYEAKLFYVVESGVAEGEEVVTTGSFLLKTEILKGSIGAGCCPVDLGKK